MKTVDELTPEEFTLPPLHQAARQRDTAKAAALIAAGADVNAADPRNDEGEGGNSPLWYAAQGLPPGGVPIAQLLVEAGADVNLPGEFNMTPLHIACSWGQVEMVRFLHEHGAKIDCKDDYNRTPVELVQADYDAGLATSEKDRAPGWDAWLQNMAAIKAYFEMA